MKKIIYLILLASLSATLQAQEKPTYIYRNYSSSIVRTPFPAYTMQGKYIYRNYENSIVREPFPAFTVQGGYIYRNYSNSIIRLPFPAGTVANGVGGN